VIDSEWKTEVMRRDHCLCQMPRCHRRAHDAHHIKTKGAHPELRYDVSNGIALCRECHTKVHTGQLKVKGDEACI